MGSPLGASGACRPALPRAACTPAGQPPHLGREVLVPQGQEGPLRALLRLRRGPADSPEAPARWCSVHRGARPGPVYSPQALFPGCCWEGVFPRPPSRPGWGPCKPVWARVDPRPGAGPTAPVAPSPSPWAAHGCAPASALHRPGPSGRKAGQQWGQEPGPAITATQVRGGGCSRACVQGSRLQNLAVGQHGRKPRSEMG